MDKKYFKGDYGCGMQYDKARKHNRNVRAAAKMRYWKERKAGRKPFVKDAYLMDGCEPPEGLDTKQRVGDPR